jgi:hypothetical protein
VSTKIALLLALALFAAEAQAPCPARAEESLAALLPPDGALPGWKKAKPAALYGPDNLWDWIDGAAVLYLDYGFQSLATADYKTADASSAATVEVYRMESPLNGFAIYAAERSPTDDFIRVGVEGYLAENVLNFWKGPYYVKVTSYKTKEDPKGVLTKLAAIVADRIPGQYAEPETFRFFPARDKLPKSERYIPKNFLGLTFFKSGYRVDYKGEQGAYQLFLVPNASPAEAEEAFANYRKHLESQGASVTLDKKPDCQTITATDGKCAFLFGSFVGGILGNVEATLASTLIEEMVKSLR